MTETIVDDERSCRGSASSRTKRQVEMKEAFCDSCPMPIVFPVFRSYKVTKL